MEKDTRQTIENILREQRLGVLATKGEPYPYTSLICFAGTPDLLNVYFPTLEDTSKYSNIKKDPMVSLLVNTGARASDFRQAHAVTVLGAARRADKDRMAEPYLERFPSLEDFVMDPSCIMINIRVEKYILVAGLRQVTELIP
ncbi:MAG: pyridoxamine 5'-phosphate oxidase family protein [Candidatus Omnitrophica bacterium]|nr:pyridoxamine 5'-phosphate oxidase family protein [Candidatus Omnitrophota bacterium]